MEIQHKNEDKKGIFFVEENGKKLAELVYSWRGNDKIVIEHTQVDEVLKGKGVAKQLIEKSIEFARTEGIKIIPVCPFAKSFFDKNEEYGDVLL